AETAGLLRGAAGFWEMHRWLFERAGSFTNPELHAGLQELGYVPSEFIPMMNSEATLAIVQEDIEQALWLGLHHTPMVFINGVELRGVFATNAVVRAVRKVLASDPPPKTAAADQPLRGAERYVGYWRQQPVRSVPKDTTSWATGPADAKLRVVVWGDYQAGYTAEADAIIRNFVEARIDTQYSFRHYPIDLACNPSTKVTKQPQACDASRAAEAAGRLGGPTAYWTMHAWLMEHQATFSRAAARDVAHEMGLDPQAFEQMMDSEAVSEEIKLDAAAGKRLGLGGVPFIIVNNRRVPKWRLKGQNPLERIMTEALGK
ncbi:MAG: DsbA family protein, partial [Phycisphaerae bacterium]